jgi:hypothetical protein
VRLTLASKLPCALWAAALSAAISGCSASNRSSAAPAPSGGPDDYAFRDAACSVERNSGADPDFDRGAAEQVLKTAAADAAVCEAVERKGRWSLELLWGPSGCVRFVSFQGQRPNATAATCIVSSYARAAVGRFTGAAARARIANGGSDLEFSRVGTLEPGVIQAVVRSKYGRFRACFEKGLARNLNLRGRVSARFAIEESGVVSHVGNAGSTLPDKSVVTCVLRIFTTLKFPKPDGGSVTVVYPVMLEPG